MNREAPPPGETHAFSEFVVRRPVAVSMLTLAVLVFGWISLGRLPLTLMPDISYPSVTLRMDWEGAAPEEVEQFISRPVEQAMGVVRGKVSITSLSRAAQADVLIEFGWDTDMDLAIQDIREKLEMVRLPDGADRPLILRYDPALDPVLRLGISRVDGRGDEAELRELRRLADELLKRELEKLPGIAAVKLLGGLEEEIRVELEEAELALRGLDIRAITAQLAAENINLAGGNLKEGRSEYVVRVLSEFGSVEDIADSRLRTADGAWIRLGDIARVFRTGRDPETLTRVGGRPSVELEIHKEADANVVRVAETLRRRLFGPGGQPMDSAAAQTPAPAGRSAARGGGGGGSGSDTGPNWLAAQLAASGVAVDLLADQSTFIEASLRELRDAALTGGLFAVLVLFLFLRSALATGIVALAIPLSVVAAFGPMQLAGLSLNIMSLGGLALGIGMLVDNAIVVLESIARCRQEGDDRLRAAVRGTGEVAQAVAASTLTTIAVFFPMVFVEGVAGQVFGDLALVVVFALSASLLLALTFIPMLSALGGGTAPSGRGGDGGVARLEGSLRHWLSAPLLAWQRLRADGAALTAARRRTRGWRRGLRSSAWVLLGPLLGLRLLAAGVAELAGRLLGLLLWLGFGLLRLVAALFGRALSGTGGLLTRLSTPATRLAEAYPRLLQRALGRPAAVLAPALLLLLAAAFLAWPRLGRELIPETRQGEFTIEFTLPLGTPLERSAARVAPVEAFLRGQPEVAGLALVVGADRQGGIDAEGGDHVARLTVRLREAADPLAQEDRLLERLRPLLHDLPETESRVRYPVLFSFKTPLEILLRSQDLETLRLGAQQVVEALEELPELVDLHTAATGGSPEVLVRFDREALGRLGLDLQQVALRLRNQVLGSVETEYRDADQRIDVRVRLRPEDLVGVADIGRLVVNPGQPIPIPLAAVAELRIGEGPAEIRRVEQRRSALIRANLAGGDLAGARAAVETRLARLSLPEDLDWQVVGQSDEMERSLASLLMALALAVFLVFVVMASQFESLVHPLVILAAVPLAFTGVVPALWALQMPLSIMVFLGAILLVGIVVNNAIILVDTINRQRRAGLPLHGAIVTAAGLRLRPILMTTATTVLGLLPMALGLGEGSEMRRPMALTVIVGLATSTLLTLVVVPVLYERVESGLARLRGLPGKRETAA
jgi:hydrophobic/amphiphilic exporter-1 (mainly G- bacteria), HAE1 family